MLALSSYAGQTVFPTLIQCAREDPTPGAFLWWRFSRGLSPREPGDAVRKFPSWTPPPLPPPPSSLLSRAVGEAGGMTSPRIPLGERGKGEARVGGRGPGREGGRGGGRGRGRARERGDDGLEWVRHGWMAWGDRGRKGGPVVRERFSYVGSWGGNLAWVSGPPSPGGSRGI